MPGTRASTRQILGMYALVCAAVYGATRLDRVPGLGQYVHLIVAAIFLLTAIRLTRRDPEHFGLALGGLLEPPTDERAAGPLGLFDLGRALVAALPSSLRETAVAIVVAAIVFPLYGVGYYFFAEPARDFQLTLPPNLINLALAQLLVVALPEEAFFRGYVQSGLSDVEARRVRILGVELAPSRLAASSRSLRGDPFSGRAVPLPARRILPRAPVRLGPGVAGGHRRRDRSPRHE